MSDTKHEVLKLWVRPAEGAPMREHDALVIETGRGVVGDHSFGRMRHVTIIFEDDWNEAAREIGRPVDPSGRRANVLLSGGGGARFVGTRLQLGEILLEVKGIVSPCPVMEKAGVGMMKALQPNGRSGIWGRVLQGGTLRLHEILTSAV